MRKNIIYTALALSLMMFSGCSDFMDQKSPDKEDFSNFWKDVTAAESGLASAYSQIESSNDQYVFGEVRYTVESFREDVITPGPDASGYADWMQLSNFTYDYSNTQFVVYWEDAYRGLMYTNQVIEKVAGIEKIDANYKEQIIAEAKFLRAYYHFKLLLNWERIIIRDFFATTEKELPKEVSPRVEAWEFIIADLKQTLGKLPVKQPADRLGRATEGAAYAYLGYAYLTRAYEEPSKKTEYLTEAEKAFKEVKGYTLDNDYLSMFNGTNKNSNESIFEVQFSDNNDGGAKYQHYLHKFVGCTQLEGWGCIRPSKRLLDEFKKEGKIATTGRYDTRAYKTIYFDDEYFNNSTTEMVYGKRFDNVFQQKDPAKPIEYIEFRKYLPATWEGLERDNSAINVPLMRFADVKLMLAETLNELNRPSEAIPLINDVRRRADMPVMTGTTYDQVKAQIEHERIVEFTLENTRFYDLRRWGKAKEALHAVGKTKFDPAIHNFYPIPQREIYTNSLLRDQLAREGK